jgi:hypothetical protein
MRKTQNMVVWVSKNGFGPAFGNNLLRLVKGTAKPNTCHGKRAGRKM